ncbi:MAG: 1-deoxy-D-xylulose-5-phosphate synthase [Deferribacteraceae bacterium]|jgi:1-deoxy-D-xylulose-5-phosphate synthase|nr:1-deoxy-D-xylulose-5-phosphate synthase [Deferribacteraceae bacterium]
MMNNSKYPLLSSLKLPGDIKKLSYDEIDRIACETREVIIDSVSGNGGHLASSLGVVEVTLALLRICDPLKDKIIWDVSHQSYPYKILTDRFSNFNTLRAYGGISGFTRIKESPYDAFGTGHASTSISAGMGIVCANEIAGLKHKVVSVIGDGALSGGMAFEALNHLGSTQKPMVVVLNDNEMSINRNVGGLSDSLSRMVTGEFSTSIRKDIRKALHTIPAGKRLRQLARKFEEVILSFFTPGILFEELGLRYIGPIEGHKVKEIEKALHTAFAYGGPVLIHVVTVKGKGYKPAEQHPENFHSISSFDIKTGEPKKFDKSKSWTKAFGEKMVSLAGKDDKVVAITAAMKDGTGLNEFASKFPERFFDTGITEQHAMTFAAGLAVAGAKPYLAIYSTFLQRAFDQIIHDVALQNLPVRICIDRAGLVGQDGPTHHGAFDLSFLRMIPNLALFLPKDYAELDAMMELSLNWNSPVAIRYARGSSETPQNLPFAPLKAGEPEVIYHWGDYAIISAGHIFGEAWKFWNILNENGHKSSLINLRFANPLNKERLISLLKEKKAIFTFEEGIRTGGIGEMIKMLVSESNSEISTYILSLPDDFVTHGSVAQLRALCNITAEYAWELFQKRFYG